MIQFARISNRLLLVVGGAVVVGATLLSLTYALRQEQAMTQEVEMSLARVTDSVSEGLRALMEGGHAAVGPDYAARLKNVPNAVDYRIIRSDGSEAFIDNATVDAVNEKLGEMEFSGRKGNPARRQAVAVADPALEQMRSKGERVFSYTVLPGGERHVTVLMPIRASASCRKCHDAAETIRGAVKLTVSLQEIDQKVSTTWQHSIYIIAALLFVIVALIYIMARRTVVDQIQEFSRAMEVAATGDMSVRLAAGRSDEIGRMARSFNHMNEELLAIYAGLESERSKLNTIISGASSGIVVTDARQNIVLLNRAAEEIIGRREADIVARGFLNLFDDPAWMEAHIAAADSNDPNAGLLDWNDKKLSVQASTLCDKEGAPLGSAALIRDITEEKRLEERLRLQSITDALTGLHNRRYFNEVSETEFKRWKRYGQPLAVMMIDVDHFKKFNDTHGHECGDRVLIEIGRVLNAIKKPSVVPCRYGGEEMIIVMPGLTQARGGELAEEVRASIAELVIDGLKVTVSIGVAGCPGHEVNTAEALVKLADDALYTAKESGRNRVCLAEAIDPTA